MNVCKSFTGFIFVQNKYHRLVALQSDSSLLFISFPLSTISMPAFAKEVHIFLLNMKQMSLNYRMSRYIVIKRTNNCMHGPYSITEA